MKHYTNIEQSKKLLELGLNFNTADLCYTHNHSSIPLIKVFENFYYLPCWSLGALLEVMPNNIGNYTKSLVYVNKRWHCDYIDNYIDNYIDKSSTGLWSDIMGDTPIEAVYNMVVLLIKNNYIETK